MAEMFETNVTDYSFFKAKSDLTDKQFYIVKLTSDGMIDLCDATSVPFGVLMNKPKAGESAMVRVKGAARVYTGTGGLSVGNVVGCDASGKAVAVTADGSKYIGMCLVAGEADGLATISVDGAIVHTLRVVP